MFDNDISYPVWLKCHLNLKDLVFTLITDMISKFLFICYILNFSTLFLFYNTNIVKFFELKKKL